MQGGGGFFGRSTPALARIRAYSQEPRTPPDQTQTLTTDPSRDVQGYLAHKKTPTAPGP